MKKGLISILAGAVLLSAVPTAMAESNVTDYKTMEMSESSDKAVNSSEKVLSKEEQQKLEKAQSEAKISKEKAFEIATEFISIPEGYERQSINFQTNWYPSQRFVWNIYWNKQEERNYGSISVTVDAETGKILQMYRNENEPDSVQTYPPKVDWKQARSIAEQLIAKQFPDKAKQIRYNDEAERNSRSPLNYRVNYSLKFDRVVSGIPFYDNYIAVNMNGNGEITGMEYRWDDQLKFAPADRMINLEQAYNDIRDSLQMKPRYKTVYGYRTYPAPDGERQIVLSYDPVNYMPFYNALTGELIDYQGNKQEPGTKEDFQPVTPRPLADPPAVLGKELTQEEALKILRDTFQMPADLNLDNVSYNENWGDSRAPVWNFNWNRQGKEPFWAYGAVNAKTGEIVNYSEENPRIYNRSQEDDFKQKFSAEAAEKIAVEQLKKLYPSKTNQVYMGEKYWEKNSENIDKLREFSFNFQRLANGIPVMDQQISITISAETGKLTRVYLNWNDSVEFPKPTGIVDENEAKAIYLKNAEIKLHYLKTRKDVYRPYPLEAGTPGSSQQEEPAVPVYSLKLYDYREPVYIDAFKGEWVSMQSGEIVKIPVAPADIKGNWAEKELKLMVEYRAIDVGEDGKVYPNKIITRGEMVKMILLASNPDPYYYQKMSYGMAEKSASFADVSNSSKYFVYVETAVQQGLLDKSEKQFRPEEEVTRSELASLIVKALRFDKLAKVEGLFNLDVKDAESVQKKGEAAIVTRLGIIDPVNGAFNADGKVSRAQAAFSFYRFLEKRAELQTLTGPVYGY